MDQKSFDAGEIRAAPDSLICQLCGSITPDIYLRVEGLEHLSKLKLPIYLNRMIKEHMKQYVKDNHCLNLIDKLMVLDPPKMLDGKSCLDHHIFSEEPLPSRTELAHNLTQFKNSMFVMHSTPYGVCSHGGGGPAVG